MTPLWTPEALREATARGLWRQLDGTPEYAGLSRARAATICAEVREALAAEQTEAGEVSGAAPGLFDAGKAHGVGHLGAELSETTAKYSQKYSRAPRGAEERR